MNNNIYERYGLPFNPFPKGSFPVEDEYEKEYAKILVGSKEVIRKIKDLIKSFEHGDNPPVVAVVGDYGFGKTHILKHIQYEVMEKISVGLPIFIKGLQNPSSLELYKKMMEFIRNHYGDEFIEDMAKSLIKNNAIEHIRRVWADYAKALEHIVAGRKKAMIWIIGGRLGTEEMANLEIYSNIEENNAKNAIIALAKAIFYGKNARLIVLIDELEGVFGHESMEDLRRFYDNLRNLIDMLQREAMFVLACPPSVLLGKQSFRKLHPALFDRIYEAIIELKKLSEDEAIKLVEDYIMTFRKSEVRLLYSPTYPFTEDAIREIYSASGGVPRRLIMIARGMLEAAARKRLTEISLSFVRKILSGEEIKEEPEDEELKLVEEAIKETEREKEAEEIVKEYELKGIEAQIVKKLRESEDNSLPMSKLSREVGMPYEIIYRKCKNLESRGVVTVKKRGSGYRVYLRVV